MRKRNTSPSWESEPSILTPIIEHARVLSRVVTPVPRKPEPDVETASFINQEPDEYIAREVGSELRVVVKSKLMSAALVLCSLSTPVCILIGVFTYHRVVLLALLVAAVAVLVSSIAYPKHCRGVYERLRAIRTRTTWMPDICCLSLFSMAWIMLGFPRSAAFFFPIALYRVSATIRYLVGARLKQEVNGSRPKDLHDVMKALPSWVRRYYVHDTLMLPSHAKSSSIWNITTRRDAP